MMSPQFESQTTIAAICTPPGDGGVAMIRLSGPDAIAIGNAVFSKDILKFASHKLEYGSFINAKQETVDQGLLAVMKAPHSYTGEDVVELFCHGGSLITKKVLHCVLAAGAELAAPGEFTQRAFLNKKMDLAQAEAVQSLISAKNEYALQMASQQLKGALSEKIQSMQKKLIDQAGILEAWVDFPEEGIEFCTMDEIIQSLEQIHKQLEKLLSTYEDGLCLKEGFKLAIIGRPNVGKSSLMNLLLNKERAIVTDIAGTTRDTIEESLMIKGMQYHIMDTAGVRSSEDIVEQEGIKRALQAAQNADLILHVMDSTCQLQPEDKRLKQDFKHCKVLYVLNKCDLKSQESFDFHPTVSISAKKGTHLEDLKDQIVKMTLAEKHYKEEVYLSEVRHKLAAEQCCLHLEKVIDGLKQGHSPEWLSYDLRSALKSLQTIIGFDITESILSSIFSRFCIGK